jgi:hypothetical protein
MQQALSIRPHLISARIRPGFGVRQYIPNSNILNENNEFEL